MGQQFFYGDGFAAAALTPERRVAAVLLLPPPKSKVEIKSVLPAAFAAVST